MFALGVVGVKYAQLEFALSGMLSTVAAMDRDATSRFISKYRNNNTRLDRMRQGLAERNWPAEIKERVSCFIDAFKVCADNRNLLMHSNIFYMSRDAIILYKSDNEGKTISCNPTLAEVRQAADDMNTYFDYGLALSKAINFNLIAPGTIPSPFPWPDAPAAPRSLEYMGGPQPVRGMYQDNKPS
jgi:hypothetical protein